VSCHHRYGKEGERSDDLSVLYVDKKVRGKGEGTTGRAGTQWGGEGEEKRSLISIYFPVPTKGGGEGGRREVLRRGCAKDEGTSRLRVIAKRRELAREGHAGETHPAARQITKSE